LDRYGELDRANGHLGHRVIAQVDGHREALLAAYAGCVRTPGYYLHSEDLVLLARLNHLDLHVHRDDDRNPGCFVEQAHVPGGNRVDIFHRGAHYEQATHT